MTELNDTTSQLNSQPKRHAFTFEELSKAVSMLRTLTNPDARCTNILNQISNHLDVPGMVELLKTELAAAKFTPGTADAIRRANQRLDNYKPLFPKKIRIARRKAKTKLNVALRIDPELARPAVALHESATFRLWAIMRDGIRQGRAGNNYATTAWLSDALKSAGISYNPESVRLLLKNGQELGFWNIHAGRIYIASYKRVAALLTRMAIDNGLPLSQDKPGSRDWYIRVSGDIGEFNAYVYAGWLASNDNPTIARQTLEALWNRDKHTLQAWERIAKIRVIENFAQTTEIEDSRIAAHAVSCKMRQSVESTTTGFRWQRTNTYLAPKNTREHGHKGQSRKVRKAVNAICKAELPAEYMAAAHPLGVRNFDTLKAYRAAWRRDSRADVPIDAHTDYLFLGDVRIRRRGKLIGTWELMGSAREPQTSAGDYEPLPRFQRAQYGDI